MWNDLMAIVQRNKKKYAALIGVVGFGFFLRMFALNKYDYWFDEIVSTFYTFPFVRLMAQMHECSTESYFFEKLFEDPHSLLYYLSTYVFTFFWRSQEALRILSVITSTFSVIFYYFLCRFFLTVRESLGAVLLLAISPAHMWYAQEARGYSLFILFSMVIIVMVAHRLRMERPMRWHYLLIMLLAGIAVDGTSIFLFYSLVMAVLFAQRTGVSLQDRFSRDQYGMFLLLAVFLAGGAFLMRHSFLQSYIDWIPRPSMESVMKTFFVFNLGYAAPLLWQGIAGVLFLYLFLTGARALYKCDTKQAVFLLTLFFGPFILTAAFSWLIFPVYLDRRLLIVLPLYYIFIIKGLSSVSSKGLRWGIGAVMAVMIAVSLGYYYSGNIVLTRRGYDYYAGVHKKKRYKALFEALKKTRSPDDPIYTTNMNSFYMVELFFKPWEDPRFEKYIGTMFFYPDLMHPMERKLLHRNIPQLRFIDDAKGLYGARISLSSVADRTPLVFSRTISRVDTMALPDRLWLVSAPWNDILSLSAQSVRRGMAERYVRSYYEESDGVSVELFVKR